MYVTLETFYIVSINVDILQTHPYIQRSRNEIFFSFVFCESNLAQL